MPDLWLNSRTFWEKAESRRSHVKRSVENLCVHRGCVFFLTPIWPLEPMKLGQNQREHSSIVMFGADVDAPRQRNSTNMRHHLSLICWFARYKISKMAVHYPRIVGSGYYPFLSPGVNQPLPFLSAPVATKCLVLEILPPWKASPSVERFPSSKLWWCKNPFGSGGKIWNWTKNLGVFEYLKILL